jgi:hypothetical protein
MTYYFLLHVSALLGHHHGELNARGKLYKHWCVSSPENAATANRRGSGN